MKFVQFDYETTRCFTKRTEITFPRTTECTQRSIIFHARSVNPGRIEENYVRCSRTEHKWKSCTVRPTGRLKGLAVIQINERGSRRGSVRPSACDPYDFSFPQVTNLSCPLPSSLSLSLFLSFKGGCRPDLDPNDYNSRPQPCAQPLPSAFFYSEPTIFLHPLLSLFL